MGAWKSKENRKNKAIMLSENARTVYEDLIKNGVRASILVEDFLLSLKDDKKKN